MICINRFHKQINSTFSRFKDYYSNGDFVFGFITDVHTGGNKHYTHYRTFVRLAKKFNIQLFINGGDIGLGLGEDMVTTHKIISKTAKNSKTSLPLILVKGNHDSGSQNISDEYLYSRLMKQNNKIALNQQRGYGVFTDTNSNLTIIFLNTTDTNKQIYYCSDEQISWLISTLNSINPNNRVVIVSHLCLDKIGMWNDSIKKGDSYFPESIKLIQRIIVDFQNHKSDKYEMNNYFFEWDFVKKTNKVLFELSGDSHFDNYIKRNGLNIMVRQGYGGVLPENVYEGGTHIPFSSNEGFKKINNCLFDIVCIKKNNDSKIFRIGVRDKEADIEFKGDNL